MIFTCPIHESNDCHLPGGSPTGGEFCSGDGGSRDHAQLVRPGQDFDVVGAVQTDMRRFLFNPTTRELVLGDAWSIEGGQSQSHAEAFAKVMGAGSARAYDRFYVHGWMDAPKPGAFSVILDRVLPPPGRHAEDAVHAFASYLVGKEAPPATEWSAGFGPKQLSTEFPTLFKKKRAKRTPR